MNAERTRNKRRLEEMAVISDLFRKSMDEEDYKLLSDTEYLQVLIISAVLKLQNQRYLRSLKVIVNNFLETPKRGGNHGQK